MKSNTKKDEPHQRRLIIDCKGVEPGDFRIFGYKNFTIKELESILDKFESVISEKLNGD